MAIEAVQRVAHVLRHFVDFGRAAPLRARHRIAHIGPVEDMVLRLAGETNGIRRRRRARPLRVREHVQIGEWKALDEAAVLLEFLIRLTRKTDHDVGADARIAPARQCAA